MLILCWLFCRNYWKIRCQVGEANKLFTCLGKQSQLLLQPIEGEFGLQVGISNQPNVGKLEENLDKNKFVSALLCKSFSKQLLEPKQNLKYEEEEGSLFPENHSCWLFPTWKPEQVTTADNTECEHHTCLLPNQSALMQIMNWWLCMIWQCWHCN